MVRELRKGIAIYSLYLAQFLKARMSYKWNFLAAILASVVISLSGLVFVFLLLDGKNVTDLRGWRREEVLFIYGYSFLATALFSTLAPNLYQFGDRYIIQGQFDRILLRPLHSLFQVLFESFNLESLGNVVVGTIVIAYAKRSLDLTFSPLDYVWLVVSALSGGIILLSFFVILASVSFHFEDRLGISAPFFNLINFGRYPLPIFNRTLQFILSWVIPFGFVAFYPATHFLSRPGFELFCYLTPAIAVVSVFIAGAFWQLGVSRYASAGN